MRSSRTMMMAGILGTLALAQGIERGEVIRIADEPNPRKRNYDLEGPKPVAGPPTAREADMPSRQQRRWLARQSAKKVSP